MKLHKQVRQTAFWVTFVALMTMVGQQVFAAQQQQVIQQETKRPTATSTVQGSCGPEMEFDRNSGRMVRKNRVDLIVTQVELQRITGNRVAIKPTIKNRCSGTIDRNVLVSIDDVVVTFIALPPNTPVTTTAVVLGEKASYRVMVDYNNQVTEINEGNNICTARLSGSETSKTHRCP
ncbi:MAG: hypothetical protein IH612_08960 [Desulfofustis sp.]|nr:hypothetical protein [Desulfofustis sp.]